jgi:hypothetical protein
MSVRHIGIVSKGLIFAGQRSLVLSGPFKICPGQDLWDTLHTFSSKPDSTRINLSTSLWDSMPWVLLALCFPGV